MVHPLETVVTSPTNKSDQKYPYENVAHVLLVISELPLCLCFKTRPRAKLFIRI